MVQDWNHQSVVDALHSLGLGVPAKKSGATHLKPYVFLWYQKLGESCAILYETDDPRPFHVRPGKTRYWEPDTFKVLRRYLDNEYLESNKRWFHYGLAKAASWGEVASALDLLSIERGVPDQDASDQDLSEATECEAWTKRRIGQARFRTNLMQEWEGKCAVTGCSLFRILRASHIVPWAEDESCRTDPANGLMLTPSLDALFDAYLISFAHDGKIMVSIRVSPEQLAGLGLTSELRITRSNPSRDRFMARHRTRFLQKERLR